MSCYIESPLGTIIDIVYLTFFRMAFIAHNDKILRINHKGVLIFLILVVVVLEVIIYNLNIPNNFGIIAGIVIGFITSIFYTFIFEVEYLYSIEGFKVLLKDYYLLDRMSKKIRKRYVEKSNGFYLLSKDDKVCLDELYLLCNVYDSCTIKEVENREEEVLNLSNKLMSYDFQKGLLFPGLQINNKILGLVYKLNTKQFKYGDNITTEFNVTKDNKIIYLYLQHAVKSSVSVDDENYDKFFTDLKKLFAKDGFNKGIIEEEIAAVEMTLEYCQDFHAKIASDPSYKILSSLLLIAEILQHKIYKQILESNPTVTKDTIEKIAKSKKRVKHIFYLFKIDTFRLIAECWFKERVLTEKQLIEFKLIFASRIVYDQLFQINLNNYLISNDSEGFVRSYNFEKRANGFLVGIDCDSEKAFFYKSIYDFLTKKEIPLDIKSLINNRFRKNSNRMTHFYLVSSLFQRKFDNIEWMIKKGFIEDLPINEYKKIPLSISLFQEPVKNGNYTFLQIPTIHLNVTTEELRSAIFT